MREDDPWTVELRSRRRSARCDIVLREIAEIWLPRDRVPERTIARAKKKNRSQFLRVYLLRGIRSRSLGWFAAVPMPRGKGRRHSNSPPGRVQRSSLSWRLDFSHRTASHAIDRVDDGDRHSSSAATPKFRRDVYARRNVAAAPGRRAGGDDRCYAGRRSHRRARSSDNGQQRVDAHRAIRNELLHRVAASRTSLSLWRATPAPPRGRRRRLDYL